MLVTKINDHVAQALARLLQQYKERPRIETIITEMAQQHQDLEDAIYSLDAGRQLWDGNQTNAVGVQLDGLGEIVGVNRNGLSDAEYLLFIFGKIASDNSDSTIDAILNVMIYLFQAEIILLQNIFPAGIGVEILGNQLDSSLFSVAIGFVEKALGAGIELDFVASSPSVDVFRFDGPGVDGIINGFSDIVTPDEGGVFVDLIS